MGIRGARAIANALRAEGVRYIFGVPGDANMELADALVDVPEITPVLTRHEQGAAFMADGYARASGQVGVVSTTKGPGAGNAFAGIANAWADSVPVLFLCGQAFSSVLGKHALQEMDHIAIFRPVSKWAFSIPTPERIPDTLRRAFTVIRAGRPGPVMVEVPMDVSAAFIEEERVPYTPAGDLIRSGADPAALDRAAELLIGARHPMIVAGQGVLWSEASEELVALAEALAAPVTTTLTGKSAFPENHPLSLGLGGYPKSVYATKQCQHFAAKADLVLGVGCSFKEYSTCQWLPLPPGVRLIHANAEVAELNRNYPADVPLLGDARLVLRDLLSRVKGAKLSGAGREAVAGEVAEVRSEWLAEWMPKLTSDEVPINPYRVTWELMQVLDRGKASVLHDAGAVRGYICHHYEAPVPRGFIGFGQHSNMGWSVPASVGAKLARPERQVVCLVGDGSFAMNGVELETAVRYGLSTLTIVENNRSLTDISSAQDKYFGGRETWFELSGDYRKMAEALGCYAERVERPQEIRPALERALAAGRAAVLEIIIKPKEPRPYTQLRAFGPTR